MEDYMITSNSNWTLTFHGKTFAVDRTTCISRSLVLHEMSEKKVSHISEDDDPTKTTVDDMKCLLQWLHSDAWTRLTSIKEAILVARFATSWRSQFFQNKCTDYVMSRLSMSRKDHNSSCLFHLLCVADLAGLNDLQWQILPLCKDAIVQRQQLHSAAIEQNITPWIQYLKLSTLQALTLQPADRPDDKEIGVLIGVSGTLAVCAVVAYVVQRWLL